MRLSLKLGVFHGLLTGEPKVEYLAVNRVEVALADDIERFEGGGADQHHHFRLDQLDLLAEIKVTAGVVFGNGGLAAFHARTALR